MKVNVNFRVHEISTTNINFRAHESQCTNILVNVRANKSQCRNNFASDELMRVSGQIHATVRAHGKSVLST